MLLVHSVFALLFSGADLYPNVKKSLSYGLLYCHLVDSSLYFSHIHILNTINEASSLHFQTPEQMFTCLKRIFNENKIVTS